VAAAGASAERARDQALAAHAALLQGAVAAYLPRSPAAEILSEILSKSTDYINIILDPPVCVPKTSSTSRDQGEIR
jgi:hypothetical protein